ncbi:MAG: ABC transporter permease, partial [Bacteroidota bacterium]
GFLVVGTYELGQLFSLEMEKGRYWTNTEYVGGADKLIIGATISEELFGALEPVGKTIKMGGRKYEVIGVLESSEGDLINPLDFDDAILVTYNNAARFINLKNRNAFGGNVGVKAREGIPVPQLEDDIRGVMRAARRLRPREEDNFAMNKLSMIADALGGIFSALNTIGFVIGFFSILVGGISVANIMFVSVKERTSLIGVKKALGARRSVILLEFLTESVIQCILGGLMGLVMVVGITSIINGFMENFDISLSPLYALYGVLGSAFIGILAGFIPASQAARMDAVEAMRA